MAKMGQFCWQRSCRWHKQREEWLMGCAGRRKNLLKEFWEPSKSHIGKDEWVRLSYSRQFHSSWKNKLRSRLSDSPSERKIRVGTRRGIPILVTESQSSLRRKGPSRIMESSSEAQAGIEPEALAALALGSST